jgi:hypothetical protein
VSLRSVRHPRGAGRYPHSLRQCVQRAAEHRRRRAHALRLCVAGGGAPRQRPHHELSPALRVRLRGVVVRARARRCALALALTPCCTPCCALCLRRKLWPAVTRCLSVETAPVQPLPYSVSLVRSVVVGATALKGAVPPTAPRRVVVGVVVAPKPSCASCRRCVGPRRGSVPELPDAVPSVRAAARRRRAAVVVRQERRAAVRQPAGLHKGSLLAGCVSSSETCACLSRRTSLHRGTAPTAPLHTHQVSCCDGAQVWSRSTTGWRSSLSSPSSLRGCPRCIRRHATLVRHRPCPATCRPARDDVMCTCVPYRPEYVHLPSSDDCTRSLGGAALWRGLRVRCGAGVAATRPHATVGMQSAVKSSTRRRRSRWW